MRFLKSFRPCFAACLSFGFIISAGIFIISPAVAKPVPVPQEKPVDPKPVTQEKTTPPPAPKPEMVPEKNTEPAKLDVKNSARIYQAACLPLLQNEATGKVLPPIHEGQCQVKTPLEITSLTMPVPIQFDQSVTTNCTMTVALVEWAKAANILAKTHLGSDIKTIGTGSHYQCRNVNNGSAGRISEHAFANALDIMSFTLTNGETTELAKDWKGSAKKQTFWRELHKKSCVFFMTVLGPEADSAHETNLHLDMGCHGKSCTYRICQ